MMACGGCLWRIYITVERAWPCCHFLHPSDLIITCDRMCLFSLTCIHFYREYNWEEIQFTVRLLIGLGDMMSRFCYRSILWFWIMKSSGWMTHKELVVLWMYWVLVSWGYVWVCGGILYDLVRKHWFSLMCNVEGFLCHVKWVIWTESLIFSKPQPKYWKPGHHQHLHISGYNCQGVAQKDFWEKIVAITAISMGWWASIFWLLIFKFRHHSPYRLQ